MSALRIEDAQRHERDRKVTYSWRTGETDAEGWALGVELVVAHHKQLRAMTVSAYRVGYRDGMVQHLVDFWGGSTAIRVATIPCARYSAKALTGAEAVAIANVGAVSDWALGVSA